MRPQQISTDSYSRKPVFCAGSLVEAVYALLTAVELSICYPPSEGGPCRPPESRTLSKRVGASCASGTPATYMDFLI